MSTYISIHLLTTGAGFYLNATHENFSKHYNMYDFITDELPKSLKALELPLVWTFLRNFIQTKPYLC